MKKQLLLVTLLLSFLSYAQEVLDNNSILEMVGMEFDESLIIDKIESSDNTFETTISVLGDLKKKGVSQKILSAMIKSAEKEVETPVEVNLSNNLQYTFKLGVKNYTVHLVKDEYFKGLKGIELESVITNTIPFAKFELKNPSTYKPTFINITRNKKGKNIVSISGTAQNDYGATKDTHYQKEFTYNTELISNTENELTINGEPFDEKEYKKLVNKISILDYRLDEKKTWCF